MGFSEVLVEELRRDNFRQADLVQGI